jgi:hypothetical protein
MPQYDNYVKFTIMHSPIFQVLTDTIWIVLVAHSIWHYYSNLYNLAFAYTSTSHNNLKVVLNMVSLLLVVTSAQSNWKQYWQRHGIEFARGLLRQCLLAGNGKERTDPCRCRWDGGARSSSQQGMITRLIWLQFPIHNQTAWERIRLNNGSLRTSCRTRSDKQNYSKCKYMRMVK